MGVNPEVSFVVACQLKMENGKIVDPRWINLDPYGIDVFGPTKEQIDVACDVAESSPDSLNAHLEKHYMWTAVGFTNLAKGEPDTKVGQLMAYDKMSNSFDWVGLVLSKLPYDNDALWALASIHQEYHSKDSFTELPLLPPEDNHSELAQHWRRVQAGEGALYPLMTQKYQRLLDDGHNYGTFQHYVDLYVNKGMWFFNEILKFGLERKDLRLGVMWIWG